MFDKFLKVAHEVPKAPHQEAFSRAPEQTLFDILSGETKLAFMCGNDDHKWIEQFAGTPLQDQAMALEQQDIQNEIAEKQYNMSNDGKQRSFWQNRDQLQLQKRMLELQLFQSKTNPAAASPMAGPAGPAGPEADAMTGGAGGGSPATPETGMMETGAKVSSVKLSAAEEQFLWADQVGRMMAKQALDMSALKGMGTTALDWAKKNPTKALSAAGGVGGAAYGAATAQGQNGQGPTIGQRLGRAAGFGALGTGVGAVAGQGVHVGKRMAGGDTFGKALGGHLESGVSNAVGTARGRASNPHLMQQAGATVDQGHALIDQAMPTVNKVQEGIAGHITNNPLLQFGGNLPQRIRQGVGRNVMQPVQNAAQKVQLAQIDAGW